MQVLFGLIVLCLMGGVIFFVLILPIMTISEKREASSWEREAKKKTRKFQTDNLTFQDVKAILEKNLRLEIDRQSPKFSEFDFDYTSNYDNDKYQQFSEAGYGAELQKYASRVFDLQKNNWREYKAIRPTIIKKKEKKLICFTVLCDNSCLIIDLTGMSPSARLFSPSEAAETILSNLQHVVNALEWAKETEKAETERTAAERLKEKEVNEKKRQDQIEKHSK